MEGGFGLCQPPISSVSGGAFIFKFVTMSMIDGRITLLFNTITISISHIMVINSVDENNLGKSFNIVFFLCTMGY
jgi:hypothetical protein